MDKISWMKIVLEQLFEKANQEIIDASFSKAYVAHSGAKTYQGHAFIKQFAKQLRIAIPDLKIQKIEMLSQTENVLTWQRTFSGTHKAIFKGIPASNKKIKWYEIVVTRFESDKIAEEWLLSDLASQMMLKAKT